MNGTVYRKTLTLEDFVGVRAADTDIVLTAAVWNKLGVYTVPNGMKVCVGALYDGYVYLRLDTPGGGQIHGKARIKVSNPTEDLKHPVLEFDTSECYDKNDKQQKPYVPLSPPWALPDSKLILEFKPHVDAADNHDGESIDCSDADNSLLLDCSYKLV